MTRSADTLPAREADPRLGTVPRSSEELSTWLLANRLAGLGTLVASVAHEINNPITYVLGNLAELERIAGPLREAMAAYRAGLQAQPGEVRDATLLDVEAKLAEVGGLDLIDDLVADALTGAMRIRDLVRDILAFGRSDAPRSARIDVHEAIEFTLRMSSQQARGRAQLTRDFGATRWIAADATRLGQVFLNLVRNAIQACSPPDADVHRVTVRTRDTESGVAIEIEDTGSGIDDSLRDRLFTPFCTGRGADGGTGLGLYLSREIVHQHCGQLTFRAGADRGTVFRVELPEVPPS